MGWFSFAFVVYGTPGASDRAGEAETRRPDLNTAISG